jgi:putative transcriptional regulator
MNRIRKILDERGITQTWLSEKLGKSYNMVNSYTTNKRQPSVEVLYQIAEILNVSIKDLLIDNTEINREK